MKDPDTPNIPRGSLTIIAGQPGDGKSLLAIALAAQQADRVLVCNLEDDHDTVMDRFRTHGMPDHVSCCAPENLMALVKHNKWDMVILDPLPMVLGIRAQNDNAQVRTALAPIIAEAQHRRFALVGVTHTAKSTGQTLGSIGFNAAARLAYATSRQKDDTRILRTVKNNHGSDTAEFRYNTTCGIITWLPPIPQTPIARTRDDYAREWLETVLTVHKDLLVKDVMRAGRQAGFSAKIIWEAAGQLNVQQSVDTMGTTWALPRRQHPLITRLVSLFRR